jgi:NAD(P)-dependent dehydrogenase (short-subunit alcohol dehydrogenase family)
MSTPKVWFITGASRGIGAELVKAALSAGDNVVATGRDRAQIVETFKSQAERVLALDLDVSDEAQSIAATQRAVERFGRIDVLVNNAGYGQLGVFEEISAAEIERQFATNVFGLFHVTRAVLPVMRGQRSGRVLNISSAGGILGFPAAAVYCSTKFAVEGFSESLALEVASFGIHVTVIEPGFTRTDFLDPRSVRYGSKVVADYAEVARKLRAEYDSYSHQQPGDPKKLAEMVVTLAQMQKPPQRLAGGSDAYGFIDRKLTSMRDDLTQYRELTIAVDAAHSAKVA